MKKLLLTLLLPALMLTACSEDQDGPNARPDQMQVQFNGAMTAVQQTKVGGEQGTMWDGGEQVGIFMLKDGGTTAADVLVANAAYTASAGETANLTAAGDPIYYPEDGSNVQFIAYYPYNAVVTDTFTLPVSVADQSVQSNIDVLYAAMGTQSYNKESGTVNLGFAHQLSKLTFTIVPGGDLTAADLAGAKIEITNQQTAAEMAYDGTLTVTAGTPTTIEALTEADGLTGQAIVLPGATTGVEVSVTTAAGRTFTAAVTDANAEWAAGYQYDYQMVLGQGTVIFTGTITPWGDGGTTDLTGTENGEAGPELNLDLTAGDAGAANTDTSISFVVDTPEAVSGIYRVMTTADYNAARAAAAGDDKDDALLAESSTALTTAQLGGEAVVVESLTPETAYTVLVQVADADGNTATQTDTVSTETAAQQGPELTITMYPGDNKGSNTATAMYTVMQSTTATWGTACVMATADVEAALTDGETLESLLDKYGQIIPSNLIVPLLNASSGLGMTNSNLTPETSYTAMVMVKDNEGGVTVKTAEKSTTAVPPVQVVELTDFDSVMITWNGVNMPMGPNGLGVDYSNWTVYLDYDPVVVDGKTQFETMQLELTAASTDTTSISAGTYNMISGLYLNELLPFTMVPGYSMGIPGGMTASMGTTYYISAANGTTIVERKMDAGNTTVSSTGSGEDAIYTFTFDVTDHINGYNYKGTYTGPVRYLDNSTYFSVPAPHAARAQQATWPIAQPTAVYDAPATK